jgi:hypothetical protein
VEATPKLGVIVHVRIDGIRLKNCCDGPSSTSIQHAPFSQSALDQSVVHLLKMYPNLPDYSAGYKEWSAHCGGEFTISVTEMLTITDATFGSQNGCASAPR